MVGDVSSSKKGTDLHLIFFFFFFLFFFLCHIRGKNMECGKQVEIYICCCKIYSNHSYKINMLIMSMML